MEFLPKEHLPIKCSAARILEREFKSIHFVRHAEGEHNVVGEKDKRNYLLPAFEDAILSSVGVIQSETLANKSTLINSIGNAQLVVVSPLRRALQTASLSFPYLIDRIPWIALECVREVTGLHPCDKRRPVSVTSTDFPHVNFEHLVSDEDPLYHLYSNSREPEEKVVERCREFMRWLSLRPEREIVVVTHSAFLRTLSKTMLNIKKDTPYSNAEIRSYIISIGLPPTTTASSSSFSFPRILPFNYVSNVKLIHFVRHAEGEHSVLGAMDKQAYLLPELEDASLTEKGTGQCIAISTIVEAGATTTPTTTVCVSTDLIHTVQLVVVSPLRRALQTASLSFPSLIDRIPWIALECVRGTVSGPHPCDKRRPVSVTSTDFPHVNFEHLVSDEDPLYHLYSNSREPEEKVVERCREFMRWLSLRPEREIVVVTHDAFLRTMFKKVVRTESELFPQYGHAEMRTYMLAIPPLL
eukprot:gene9132-18921_t